jgi:hypothetical protein
MPGMYRHTGWAVIGPSEGAAGADALTWDRRGGLKAPLALDQSSRTGNG